MAKDGITIAGAEGVYGMLFDVGDDFYISLYDGAKLDENTGGYTAIGEVNGPGYMAGGKKLSTPRIQRDGNCFVWDFEDVTWNNSSLTADCGLIYNKTRGRSLCVISFPRTVSRNGVFRLIMPSPTAQEGAVRFYF